MVEGGSSTDRTATVVCACVCVSYRTWPNWLVLANTGVVMSGWPCCPIAMPELAALMYNMQC